MQGTNLRKEYFWELREFKHCDPDKFKQMLVPEKNFIYFFKKNIPDVVVRIEEPVQKIHGWTFSQIQVLQRLNDNPKVFHWKRVYVPFKGELILSLLQNINFYLKTEIGNALPKRTIALDLWINSSLDDVFFVKIKSQVSFGHQHGFCEIKTLYRTRYINYFQTRSWRSNTWEGLLDIVKCEKLQANSSYGVHLNEIDNFIGHYQVINNQHYEDMFELNSKKKPPKERPKDKFQKDYERKVLLKYGLHEYLDQ